jgi:chromosomal replication initiator protein
LEGAVIKLLAYSSLKHQEITVAMAEAALKETLKDFGTKPKRELSGRDIQEAVARRWGVEPAGLRSRRRTRDLMIPRQVAMYLMRELLDLPLTQIGSHFGGRDHSTVIHSIKKVEEGIEVDDTLAARVAELRGELSGEM